MLNLALALVFFGFLGFIQYIIILGYVCAGDAVPEPMNQSSFNKSTDASH
jgi:hypothetical protein